MTSWHSYPKVYALGHRYTQDLFLDPVLVEEKVDGSQFSFGRFDGVLKCKTHHHEVDFEHPDKMFAQAIAAVQTLDLNDGWTYRAEYLNKPKHNVLTYDRVPVKNLIIFDINTAEETYLEYHEKEQEAKRIGLEIVPILYTGRITDATSLLALLERTSILGGAKIEGVVVKNYLRFGNDKKAVMGKYVSEAFKEHHKLAWKPTQSAVESIIAGYKTEARWLKAIQHLREAGKELDGPQCIGDLIREVHRDFEEECKDAVMTILYNDAIKRIRGGLTAGLPEWYKKLLMEATFEVKN